MLPETQRGVAWNSVLGNLLADAALMLAGWRLVKEKCGGGLEIC